MGRISVVIWRSFKLYFAGWKNTLFLALSLLLCILGVSLLAYRAGEQSRLSVGIADLDNSKESRELLETVKKNPALNIKEGGKDGLLKKLLKRELTAVYVIKPGFGEKLEKGDTEGLFSAHALLGEETFFLISDIIAGDLMEKALSSKTNGFYSSYEKKHGDYSSYLKNRMDDPMFDYEFTIVYKKNTTGTEGGKTTEASGSSDSGLSMIYYRIMQHFVLLASLLLLLEMVGCAAVKSQSPIGLREKSVQSSGAGEFFGIFIFAFTLIFIFRLIISLVFWAIMEGDKVAGRESFIFKMFFGDLLAHIPFYVLFYLGKRKLPSAFSYQSLGFFLIIIYGGLRVFSLFYGI